MHWVVDDGTTYYDVDELMDHIFDPDNYDDDDEVNEYIDSCCDAVEVGGRTFNASEILAELDFDTWLDYKHDWQESQSENDKDYYASDLENMEDGEYEWFNNYKVTFCADEEDEEDDDEESGTVNDVDEAYVRDLLYGFQSI